MKQSTDRIRHKLTQLKTNQRKNQRKLESATKIVEMQNFTKLRPFKVANFLFLFSLAHSSRELKLDI